MTTPPHATKEPHAKLIDPLRAPTPRKRVPSPEEAHEIMRRFNASHFNLRDQEHARYRIPADHSHDDDLLMAAFIDHAAASLRALEEKNEVLLVAETALHIFIEARKHNGYGMADAEESARTALARIRAAKKDNQKGKQ